MKRFAAVLIVQLLTGAYSSVSLALNIEKVESLPEPKIQYLGVGGWLLHWQGEGVLISPSFSNPSLMGIKMAPPVRVKANKTRIDRVMPEANDVTMLLVGHGHYDHLLDVPWVMAKQAPNATLYGSTTVKNILHAFSAPQKMAAEGEPWVDSHRVVDATPFMERVSGCENMQMSARAGTWIYSKEDHLRAMPIQSMHASHILGYTVAHSESPVLNDIPTTVFGWKQGQSMAWLIDLLDERKQPTYRIHFQDSPSTPPCGLPPVLNDGKSIDVEILGVAGWENVDNYPEQILKSTKPKLVLLGHWENFFGNDPKQPPVPMPLQNVEGMVRTVEQILSTNNIPATVRMPAPFGDVPLPTN
ncbi:hypothetical protein I6G64_21065 [Serratia plymuthica]|uniref:MBL fold metallo-hydrolase n=1 Tax=Serratia plymuthica TaxID=82996 RepID=A0A7T2SQZ7_SERPL|nr:hypothetical protein [Serratia plymuthica]QPS20031.1 hypothetical protein I6G64_21065 [Serratia plymuthica]